MKAPSAGIEPTSSITATDLGNQTGTRACGECGTPTTNPKFCSRSCSAIHTNKESPRRMLTKQCGNCGVAVKSRVTYCNECRPLITRRPDRTIEQMQGAMYQKSSRIRQNARDVMKRSGIPAICSRPGCGYDKHVEVSHVTPISRHSLTTLESVVNRIDNLEYLCPNHHWEHEQQAKGMHISLDRDNDHPELGLKSSFGPTLARELGLI